MAKYGGQNKIQFGVHFNTDKSSLQNVKKSLQQIQNIKLNNFAGAQEDLIRIQGTAKDLERMLTEAFNVKLNSVNVDKFNQSLQNSKYSIQSIYQDFSKAGPAGQKAFNQMATSVLTTNLQLKQTHSLINQMGTTMMNTVKWGIASSVFNNITSSVAQAFDYVKALDGALTDIRIVTGDSREEMAQFAQQANRAAQSLGRSTMEYSKAALTYYQQGLSDQDVQARTEATLKAQNITGAGSQMADYLTAVWNGYKVANEQAELYVDKLAAVADSSASNMSQLAVAMSKVASTANALGVPVDSLNAQIATIVATTRQAPESVGNALKTIYARINDISTGAEGAEISLGNYSSKMAQVGISVLDANGNLRDTGDVIEEIGGKWANLSREEQIYLARTMAGQRQYNNLIALFDNWGKYTDLVTVSMESQGATMQKNSRYMESLEAHMNQLGAAGQRVKSALINADSFKGLVDVGTNITTVFANFIESIGGGGNALLMFGSIATQVFSGVISKEIGNLLTNINNVRNNLNQLEADIVLTSEIKNTNGEQLETVIHYKEEISKFYKDLSAQEINSYNNGLRKVAELQQQNQKLQQVKDLTDEIIALEDESRFTLFDEETGERVEVSFVSWRDHLQQMREELVGLTPEQATEGFYNLGLAIDSSTDQFAELNDAHLSFDELNKKFDDGQISARQFNQIIDQVFNKLANIDPSKIGQIQAKIDQNTDSINRGKTALDDYLKEVEKVSNIKAFTKALAGVGQLASGITTLTNITKIWGNENLSTGQKVLQTFTSIASGAGMVVNGVKSIYPMLVKMSSALLGQAGAAGVASGAETAHAITLQSVAAAAGKAIAAIWPMLVIAAAIAAAVIIFKKLSDAWNADAIAAQNAAKAAEQAKQAYDDAKKSLDELKTSLDKLNDSYDAIDQLTYGTQEWRDAVREVNDQVLELIKKYPELADEVKNVNGVLKLSKEGQEKAIQAQQATVDMAQRSSIAAAQNARDMNINSEATDLGRKNSITEYTPEGQVYTRTLDKEGVQAVVKSAQQLRDSFAEEGKLIDDQGKYTQQFITAVSQNSKQAQDLTAQLLNDEAGMKALENAMLENAAATRLQNETIAAQMLQDNQNYKNGSDSDKALLTALSGSQYGEQTQALTNEFKKQLTDYWRTEQGSNISLTGEDGKEIFSSNDILRIMAQEFGQASLSWASNSITGGANERMFHFAGADGTHDVSADFVASTLAAAKAMEQFGMAADRSAQLLGKISESDFSQTQQNAVKDFLSGTGFGDYSKAQLQAANATKLTDIYSEDELQQIIDALGESLGVTTTQELVDAFHDSAKIAEEMFLHIPDGMAESVKTVFNSLKLDDKSFNVQQNIANALNDAFTYGGQEGLNTLTNLLNSVPQQDFDAFSNIINGIDWTDPSALTTFNQAIQQQAIDIDKDSVEWQRFEEYLLSVTGKVHNADQAFEKLRGTLQNIKDISDIETGQVIDDQTYQELLKINPQLEKYFKLSTDGYMFVGAQQDVAELLKTNTQATIDSFRQMGKAAQAVINSDSIQSNLEGLSFEEDDILSYQNTARLSSLSANDAFKNALNYIGVDEEAFEQARTWLKQHQGQTLEELNQQEKIAYENNKALVESAINDVNQLSSDYDAGKFGEQAIRSLTATSAQSMQELRNFYYEGMIQAQDYDDMREVMVNKEIKRLGITRQQYDATFNTLEEGLEKGSDSFKKLSKEQKKIELDQLTSRVFDLGDALESLSGISEDTFNNIQYAFDNGLNVDSVEGFSELRTALSEIFQTDIDTSQIEQNFNLIQQLANGDMEALGQLQAALGQDYIAKIAAEADIPETNSALLQIQGLIDGTTLNNLDVGISLDDAGFTAALQQFALMAGMSAEQINDLLGQIGFEPEVTYQDIPVTDQQISEQNGVYTYHYKGPNGEDLTSDVTDYLATSESGASVIRMPIINGKKTKFAGGIKTGNFSAPKAPKPSGGGRNNKGGGSTPKTPKKVDPVDKKIDYKQKDDIVDPYQMIEKSLDRQQKKIKNLQSLEKRVSGKERLKNIDAQNKLLDKQNKKLRDRQKLSEKAGVKGTTANLRREIEERDPIFSKNKNIFDENGDFNQTQLTNQAAAEYNRAAKAASDEYQAAQARYNKWLKTVWNNLSQQEQKNREAQKKAKDTELSDAEKLAKDKIKTAEDEYKARTDLLKDYQKALKEDEKYHQQYIQNLQKQIQNRISTITIKIELAGNAGQLERDMQELEDKIVRRIGKDDFLGQARSAYRRLSSFFDSDEINQDQRAITALQKRIEEVSAQGYSEQLGISEKEWNALTTQQQKKLKQQTIGDLTKQLENANKQLIDDLSSVQEEIQTIKELYLDAIDAANDRIDQQIDQYERINGLIDHGVKMTQLLYGDRGYQTLNKYYEKQAQNNSQQLDMLRRQQQMWIQKMNNQDPGSQAWKKYKEHADEATKQINSKLEQMVENIATKFENKLAAAVENVNNKMTNGRGMDYLDEEWDYANMQDDYFLDAVESKMGIDQVTREYQKALNDAAGNPKQYQKINDLMGDQLDILKEKDKLTQYDLDRAKSMLEVEQARMALEDARNNKTQMRLRRDSQGNYTYQYVADEEKLTDLEDSLAKAQQDLYNLDKEHYKENLNKITDTWKEFLQKNNQLAEEYRRAESANDEAEMNRILQRRKLMMTNYAQFMDGLREDNKYNLGYYTDSGLINLGKDPSQLTDEEKRTWAEQVLPFVNTQHQGLSDMITAQGGFESAVAQHVNETWQAAKDAAKEIQDTIAASGTSVQNIKDAVDVNIVNAQRLLDSNKQIIKSCNEEIGQMQFYLGKIDEYLNGRLKLQDLMNTLYGGFNTVLQQNGAQRATNNYKRKTNGEGLDYEQASTTQTIDNTGKATKEQADKAFADTSKYVDQQKNTELQATPVVVETPNLSDQMTDIQDQQSASLNAALNENAIAQREGLFNDLSGLISNVGLIAENTSASREMLEQVVNITANFPDATSVQNIEDALQNLVNIASMKASVQTGG